MFAVLLGVLVTLTAMTLELGRWTLAQSELQAALDAGVLAGAAKLQINQADTAGAIAAAEKAFKANSGSRLFGGSVTDNVKFSVDGNSVVGTGASNLAAVFGNVLNVNSLGLTGSTTATITNSSFEVSMMLDITGSMCDSAPGLNDAPCTKGEKLDAMKKAAGDLVNSLLASTELQKRVRVAVVPFSDGVRLPSAPRGVAAGLVPLKQTFSESYQECTGSGKNKTCTTKYNYYYYYPTECVAERMGNDKYTDAAPGPGNYMMTMMRLGTSATDSTATEFGCTLGSTSVVKPLTNDKTALLSLINSLSAKGGTAGQLGTAWAWYTLSPNFKNVWTGASDDAAAYPAASDKTLRKIAILMTDGDYNNQFSVGGYRVGSWAYTNVANSVTNGTSSAQAQTLCSGMKAKGIEVYTVGYDVSSAAKTFLQTCATDNSHAYVAGSGEELATVFKSIGQKVLALYLSK